ncbi:hypothetical protein GSB9_01573 [Flavobacteriaceae bacterium GSB9]|nr:hypothetical protein GSB9_01573 [Flavobacteriaceae bacterium GSB9]
MKKKLSLLLILLLAFLSCKNNNETAMADTVAPTTTPSIKGAWELVSFLNYSGDGTVDTIKTSNTFKQMKMFSETKIMWSRLRTGDSLDWFGVGDYTFENGILTENLDYGSKAMRKRIEANKIFDFEIIIDENSFTQIEKDSLGHPIYAETYHRVK